jgi:hypothetical protein
MHQTAHMRVTLYADKLLLMAPFPRWYSRIDIIRGRIQALSEAWVDRPTIEKIFGLSTRQAQNLMQQMSGLRIGRSIVVRRQDLLRRIDEIGQTSPAAEEMARKSRLASRHAEDLRKWESSRKKVEPWKSLNLPPGVRATAPGVLEIRSADIEELLTNLHAILRCYQDDPEAVERLLKAGDI